MATDTTPLPIEAYRAVLRPRRAEERTLAADARDELTALRAEGREAWAEVDDLGRRVHNLLVLRNAVGLEQTGARLRYLAQRQIARLSVDDCPCGCHEPTADVAHYAPGWCGLCALNHYPKAA